MTDTRDKIFIAHIDVGRAPKRNLVINVDSGPNNPVVIAPQSSS